MKLPINVKMSTLEGIADEFISRVNDVWDAYGIGVRSGIVYRGYKHYIHKLGMHHSEVLTVLVRDKRLHSFVVNEGTGWVFIPARVWQALDEEGRKAMVLKYRGREHLPKPVPGLSTAVNEKAAREAFREKVRLARLNMPSTKGIREIYSDIQVNGLAD